MLQRCLSKWTSKLHGPKLSECASVTNNGPLHPQRLGKRIIHLPGFSWEATRRKHAVTLECIKTNLPCQLWASFSEDFERLKSYPKLHTMSLFSRSLKSQHYDLGWNQKSEYSGEKVTGTSKSSRITSFIMLFMRLHCINLDCKAWAFL